MNRKRQAQKADALLHAVNLDLLECCHLTSTMLLEVPAMVVESGINSCAGAS